MLVKLVVSHRTKAKTPNNFPVIFSWTKSWFRHRICASLKHRVTLQRPENVEFRHWPRPLHHLQPTVAIVTFLIAARHYSACSFLYVMCLVGSYVRCFEWGINKWTTLLQQLECAALQHFNKLLLKMKQWEWEKMKICPTTMSLCENEYFDWTIGAGCAWRYGSVRGTFARWSAGVEKPASSLALHEASWRSSSREGSSGSLWGLPLLLTCMWGLAGRAILVVTQRAKHQHLRINGKATIDF